MRRPSMLPARQRMLSQKLSKAALELEVANNDEARQHSQEELRHHACPMVNRP